MARAARSSKRAVAGAEASPWPRGARCAVTLTFDFDAETGWLSRDPETADRPGMMSQGRYGAKVAVPRLLRLLAAEGSGRRSASPDGWSSSTRPSAGDPRRRPRDRPPRLPPTGAPAGSRRRARRVRARHEGAGERARACGRGGYRAPAWELTPITLDRVRKHGMMYSSNLMDDAWPYLHPGAPPVVELPVQWLLDDAPYSCSIRGLSRGR